MRFVPLQKLTLISILSLSKNAFGEAPGPLYDQVKSTVNQDRVFQNAT
jgi:hypothetical protein